ncbi:MAG TPA: nickel-dependent hydrogenase large subunit [Azospira sp.]|nr:nickel-dependent hydrogenase large subunit [Azospira sp.]
MSRLVMGPFNRVEGDLEVSLDVAEGKVAAAWVNAPLYRGFEHILQGKAPADALVIVPRICGICSVSQSAAAASALAAAMGLTMPANGRLARNLIQACENVADHLTHFYLFFMPDFARPAYAGRPWFGATEARFKATVGRATAEVLPARGDFLRVLGYLAGKWPHTLAIQPGGTTRAVLAAEKIRLYAVLREFRAFLEQTLFGDSLEAVAALNGAEALHAWSEGRSADFPRFLALARDLGLEQLGRGGSLFLSVGVYPGAEGQLGNFFPAGTWDQGTGLKGELDLARVTEDHSHAWLAGDAPVAPAQGTTQPLPDKEGAYTWCKAPRYGGQVAEVGALARQLVAGHPLLRDLARRQGGGSVLSRVVARLMEIAILVPAMESWVQHLVPGEPFCHHGTLPDNVQGVGLTEAARGSLGHWLTVKEGRIASYQIVAPTTWNFSPRDATGTPGALEQALAGIPIEAADTAPVAVQHVVRSFDPCMVCTVH